MFASVGVGPGFTGANCAFAAKPNATSARVPPNRIWVAVDWIVRIGSLLLLAFGRGFWAGGPEENLLSIREGDVAAVGARRSIFGLKAFKNDLGPNGQRGLCKTVADESVGRAPFDRPFRRGSIGVLYRDVNPRVRIDHLN